MKLATLLETYDSEDDIAVFRKIKQFMLTAQQEFIDADWDCDLTSEDTMAVTKPNVRHPINVKVFIDSDDGGKPKMVRMDGWSRAEYSSVKGFLAAHV